MKTYCGVDCCRKDDVYFISRIIDDIDYILSILEGDNLDTFSSNQTGADVLSHCPKIGRSSVLASLKKLTEEGIILREGSGRSTFYVRAN